MSAFGDIFFKSSKSPLPPNHFVIFPITVETYPYTIGMASPKRQLGVGRDRRREKANFTSKIYYIIDTVIAIAPYHHFASFEIDKTGAQPIGIFQLAANLFVGHDVRIGFGINRTMFAFKIAFIGYKQDRLQRSFAPQYPRAEKPICQIEHL